MIRVAIAGLRGRRRLAGIGSGFLRRIVRVVLEGEGVHAADISLALVDNRTIQKLNQLFLDHDEPTDVLSFPLGEGRPGELSGEVVLGVEVAGSQAKARGHDVKAELALYVIHGLLHLCGLDDLSARDRKKMRARESHYLGKLGLPDIADKSENREKRS